MLEEYVCVYQWGGDVTMLPKPSPVVGGVVESILSRALDPVLLFRNILNRNIGHIAIDLVKLYLDS